MARLERSDETPPPSSDARPHRIGLGQAVALYVGAVLGAGVLVLPGQAASMAGPASLLAWLFVGGLGVPLAMTFAALGTRYPDAGGIATFAARAFGPAAGGVAGWFYYVAVALGHIIVPLTGGYYIATALRLDQQFAFIAAGVILALATAANLGGLRLSGRLQLGLAAGVGLLLLAATLTSLPEVQTTDFHPFAPAGLTGIGHAAVALFFAFAGWEAVTHLAGEFRDVRRDLSRATLLTVGIVVTLYLGVALSVIATGAYGDPRLDRIAVGQVLGTNLGFSATATAGVLATVISLGTTNAFMAAISRLGYALARDQWLPRPMTKLSTRGVPTVGVWTVAGLGAAGLIASYLNDWGTEDIVGVPASLVLITYLIGTAAGARLLTGHKRALAVTAFLLTAVVAPFAAAYITAPVIVAIIALAYRHRRKISRRPTTTEHLQPTNRTRP